MEDTMNSTLESCVSYDFDQVRSLDFEELEYLLADENAPRAGLLLAGDDAELQRIQAEWNARENGSSSPWVDCATQEPGCLTESLLRFLMFPKNEGGFSPSFEEAGFTETFSVPTFSTEGLSFGPPKAEISPSRHFPRGREPFVSKAMTWLRLADLLIAGNLPVPSFIFSGYGAVDVETRREILRLLRLYLMHHPRHAVFLALTPQETLLLPEEDLEQLRLRIRIV